MKRALLWCVLANVIGGSTFAAMAGAHAAGLPTVTFSFLRTLLSTLLFALVAWRAGVLRPRFSARDWLLVGAVAVPGFALPLILGIRGVALSTPGLGSILALLEPIMIVPLSVLFLRESLPRARLLGIAIGLAGALLVVLSGASGAEATAGLTGEAHAAAGAAHRETLLGNALLAIQGSLWALYTVAAKPLTARHSALSISTWSTALGCLAMGLFAPLEWSATTPSALQPVAEWLALEQGPATLDGALAVGRASLPWMAYLALFGSFLGVLLWNAGLEGVAASRMAGFIFLQPAVGLLLDYAMGAPPPALHAWLGLGAIALAVLFVSREPKPSESATR